MPPDNTDGDDAAQETVSHHRVVWRDDRPLVVVEEDGVTRLHPLKIVPSALWRSPHWRRCALPDWATSIDNPTNQFLVLVVHLAGQTQDSIDALRTGQGEKLIGRKVKKGRVAYATAENPDDLRMRMMVACFIFNVDARIIDRDILISDNRVRPEEITDWVKETGEAFTLIIIDTRQAFFDGRDPNNNAEAASFTRRFRPLAAATGLPVVIIAAHPPKQASDENLIPYGGGATLNEVDGNFTLALDGESGLYRFSWLGKIRGLPFEPLYFRIDRLDSPDVVTVEGARVQMPVMFPVDEEAVEARQEAFATRDLDLLRTIAADPTGSTRKWSVTLKWSRRAVTVTLSHLKKEKLVDQKARRWRLTKEGERLAQKPETEVEK